LERAGYTCTIAESGDQALWAVDARPPDALVVDVMIPHPSGIEVCRHLRSSGFAGAIVVVSAAATSTIAPRRSAQAPTGSWPSRSRSPSWCPPSTR
jgi:DNA-binding response OmpR family regulator